MRLSKASATATSVGTHEKSTNETKWEGEKQAEAVTPISASNESRKCPDNANAQGIKVEGAERPTQELEANQANDADELDSASKDRDSMVQRGGT